MSEREELLPCPFCGSTPKWWGGDPPYVFCVCLAAPSVHGPTEERVATIWNTRAEAILSRRPAEWPREGAIKALADYRQADMDGVMVLVSRQAIDECLPALRSLSRRPADDEGLVLAVAAETVWPTKWHRLSTNDQDAARDDARRIIATTHAHDPALREAREALEPFGDVAGEGDEDFPDSERAVVKFGRTTIFCLTLGDIRRARAVLCKLERK